MSDFNETFTTFDIIDKFELNRERLRDWINRGFVKPSVQVSCGPGTKNLFSRFDLYGIKLFIHLLTRGFSRDYASKISGNFVDLHEEFYEKAKHVYDYVSKKLHDPKVLGGPLPEKIDFDKAIKYYPWLAVVNRGSHQDAFLMPIRDEAEALTYAMSRPSNDTNPWRAIAPDLIDADDIIVINVLKIKNSVDVVFGIKG